MQIKLFQKKKMIKQKKQALSNKLGVLLSQNTDIEQEHTKCKKEIQPKSNETQVS
ncbi:hypothetical protein [Gracilibacillus dipsosauri]|uniref:hypothetical protein n=1 Tax=Gracilibacillus dipsosauri TaxID=178340 RepID=UPI002409A9A7